MRKQLLAETKTDRYFMFAIGEITLVMILDETTTKSIQAKENYIKIIESQEYNNLMMFLRAWMSSIFTEGPILREELVSIINVLESEIKKNEN